MSKIDKHVRVNDILLGPLERPALQWLAAHMPNWVTPDVCTAVGLSAALGIMISYGLSGVNPNFLWVASAFFVVNWFGDSLDGTLARYRHIERPVYGYFLDHTVDAVAEVMVFLGLGLTPHISFVVASLALVGYLIIAILAYLRTAALGEFRISFGKLGPTEVRVLAILLNAWMYFGGVQTFSIGVLPSGPVTLSPYDFVMCGIALLLLYFFITTAWQDAKVLRRAGR